MEDELLELHNINEAVEEGEVESDIIALQTNSSYLSSLWIGSGEHTN